MPPPPEPAIGAFLAEDGTGDPPVLLVTSDAGVGKSRLAGETRAIAAALCYRSVLAIYSGASVLICTPNALATGSNGHPPLGTIAADGELRSVLEAGGFSRFRRATETPFNRVFEARP